MIVWAVTLLPQPELSNKSQRFTRRKLKAQILHDADTALFRIEGDAQSFDAEQRLRHHSKTRRGK